METPWSARPSYTRQQKPRGPGISRAQFSVETKGKSMARFGNEDDRGRGREGERERDRDRGYDRDRQHESGRAEWGRRHLDLGQRSNEYGSHAGWGGQGFSQGSFGAPANYSGREMGGGMSAYQGYGEEQSSNRENYGQGRGSERWTNPS